ncbi:Calx-beta domain-containing protein [Leptolyngbya sp. 7M]|uniref:Calx-beta domain-containing protein n=1 Tax=Leptolyngbya sp. 7M TaxID=2812896 RepID=UPI001B8CC5A7|nr:Calx-beta domain-containing protein [Leptolyngbya sp. 7M]QYO65804.1 FG-GAP-like repeat-containing protein [Leptolyngbya sp. 7M]
MRSHPPPGDATVTGALALTNGEIVTGANTLVHNGAVTRTNGFVNGNLRRDFSSTGAYTYHVGQNGYSPVAANVTAGTGSLSVRAVGTVQPNIPNPSKALSRHWKLSGTGVTSDLTFSYLDPADIPGTANENDFVILKYDGAFTQPGGTVNTGANTATITGVSSFSDWTLAEPGALISPGILALSNSSYSVNENAGNVTITVNRTGGTDGAVGIDYSLGGGTATGGASCGAGIDYINTGGTVSFANGEASKTFNVTICDDSTVESDETFDVTLSNPTGGATLGTPATATVTIVDDDVVTGPVTVTASAGTTSGSYNTLTEAVAAINDGTHQGDIVVNINQNTTEPGTVVLNSSGAGSASYSSVLIRPGADGVTVSGASAQGRGLIELNGADNVTIDGDNPNTAGTNRDLTIHNTASNTTTFTSVVRIALNTTTVTSADNNIVRNLNIVGSSPGRNISTATTTAGSENTTFGIFLGPNASGATTAPTAVASVSTGVAAGATASNLLIQNNRVVTAARAISINGAATSVAPGLQIRNNEVGNSIAGAVDQVTAIGITVNGSSNAVIAGNLVWVEGFIASSAAGQGINVGVNSTNTTGAVIEKNRVNRVQNNNVSSWSAYGINVTGIIGSAHVVRNNFVSGVINNQTTGTGAFGTTFGAYGIRIGSGTNHVIYHNSVNLYGTMPGVTNTNLTAAFLIVATGQTGVDVRNNIFVNTISGGNPSGTRNVAVFLPSGATSAMNLTLNNNDYFVGSDAQNRLAQVGTAFGTGEYTLDNFDPTTTTPATNFRAYTSTLAAGGNNDNASKKVDPSFTSNADLHILPTSLMESAGVNVGVVDDIDGDPRPSVPDIGADEITVSGPGQIQFSSTSYSTNEGSAATINVIRSAGLDGTVGITVTLTDGTATGGAACTAGVDYINPGPQTLTFGNGVGLQTFNVQTCTDGTLKANETVNLTLSNPTGGATIGTNNPATLTIVDVPPPLSGTINVGTGEVFTSLTNPGGVFQAINGAGLNGDLTINITSDLTAETGAVALNQISEFGAGGYTLTIKPSGAARTISGTGATNNGLINLNGADRVVIDGSLSGGTDRSLTIVNLQTGTSTVIWIRSASASNGATNNTVKNTVIHGAGGATAQTTAGILAGSGTTIGGPAEAPNNNNSVVNNWIHTVQNSIYNQGNTGLDQNWLVTDNEFGSTVEAEKNRFRGMLMGNANNFVIRNNTVLGVTNFTGTTGALTGIQLAFAVTNGSVTGNRISNVHNLSASGTGAFGMQLSATPTTNILIANNFIWNVIAAGSATVASNGHGITVNAAATAGGYKIYHNSINLNTNQASGTTAALNLTSAVVAAGALDVRNNIFANTQTAGATRRAVHSAAAASVFSTINYNDYFSTGSVGFIGGTDRPTLANWQTGTGQDANSLAVDPLFVSATDLHIQSGSPMINAGTPLADVVTDIDGDPRSATTPDIGADEFVSSGNPGSLQFSSPTYSGSEGASPFTVTVTRTGGSDGTVTVDFATSNGTATGGASCTPGVDYITTNGTLTFPNGVTSQTFNVVICDDLLDEPDETFNYTLSNPTGGAVLGTPSTAVQTIEDNDPAAGSLSVNDVRVFEGNAGTVNMTFTVTHTGAGFASVDYSTSNGTATAGVDYLATGGTLTFNTPIYNAVGIPQQTQTVTVSVVGDTFKEANETLFLNLSNPINASITDAQGTGIIIDDDRAYVADSDRDLKGDIGIYRPSEGTWYIAPSTGGAPLIVDLGDAGTAVPGDYDGDGKMDLAVWDAATGIWTIRSSQTSGIYTEQLGQAGDIPVQGDYDGDGRTDLAVFRPSSGDWWIRRSSNGTFYTVNFGLSGDRPVQGDYDGDAKTDIAVYRGGIWYIFQSRTNTIRIASWGLPTDIPLSGDFDGDGSNDLAIYRNGQWWILDSLTNTSRVANWGVATDIPAPADYDGDGTTDIVVFRPSTGDWYLLYSGGGSGGSNWGLAGDVPAATAYMPY